MCLYPKLIDNPKYKANKKNGGIIPPLKDERVALVPIGCQQCIECRKQKARNWQVRLTEDIKNNTNGKFITLTFSNESIKKIMDQMDLTNTEGYELDNAIATQAVRWFLERWRKKYKKSLRHWLVTEIGHEGTENIHLHGIIWTNESLLTVEEIWGYGYVWKGKTYKGAILNYVSQRTVNYIIKYVMKIDTDHKYYNSIVLTSPGIGSNYTNRHEYKVNNKFKENGITNETYRLPTGGLMNLPIYYRNKRYSDSEREILWIQKIDKGERWICGHKLINPNENDLHRLLEHYRQHNKRMGYGSDEKSWDREQYERQRRRLQRDKRLMCNE